MCVCVGGGGGVVVCFLFCFVVVYWAGGELFVCFFVKSKVHTRDRKSLVCIQVSAYNATETKGVSSLILTSRQLQRWLTRMNHRVLNASVTLTQTPVNQDELPSTKCVRNPNPNTI